MKKYSIAILLSLMLIPLSALADKRITVVSVPLLNTQPVTAETGTMTMELIRTHIINSQKIKVVEDTNGGEVHAFYRWKRPLHSGKN